MDNLINAAEMQQIEETCCENSSVAAVLPEKKEWYQTVSLEDAKAFIRANLGTAARSFIAIGFYLKHIRDNKLFLEEGHATIWEFAQEEFCISKSTASRYMSMNDRFSKDGNSPLIDERYKGFEKSKLQEMLSLTDEQLEQVTPDMKVQQIREMRKPKEVPYYEMEGQMEFEVDFPEILPDPEANLPVQSQTFTMDVSDMFVGEMPEQEETEPVAISQQQEDTGLCLHRPDFPCTLSESAKHTLGDGMDCSHSCCWDCVNHRKCRLECYASANRPEPELPKAQQNPENAAEIAAEPLSAYGTPKKVYPEGSLIATEGCVGGHYCFSCAMECGIRGEDRYCREAPMGNPFPCEHIVWGLQTLQKEIGNECQFINHDLAEHCAGSGEADPCCKNCADPCEYICARAMKKLDGKQEAAEQEKPAEALEKQIETVPDPDVIDAEFTKVTELDEYTPQYFLQKEQEKLNEMLEAFKNTPPDQIPQKLLAHQKIIVAALTAMVCDLENEEIKKQMEEEKPEQPELPVMRNNDQRKAFLDTFHDWPVWFRVTEASEVYYRYDLPDGTALVICEYQYWLEWRVKYGYEESPESVGTREYFLVPGYHYLHDCLSNRTTMIEKLKEIQKKG